MTKDLKLICRLNKDWQPDKIRVKRAGGQTNRNYFVQYKDKRFFVRLPWERTDIVDRKIEAKKYFCLESKQEDKRNPTQILSLYISEEKYSSTKK